MPSERPATVQRPRLIWAACWGIWGIVAPITVVMAVRMALDPGFREAPVGMYRMPLPAGFVPLLMFVASTVGLWRQHVWGVYAYGAAGLIGLLIMAFWPGSRPLFDASVPANGLVWALFAGAHTIYTIRLYAALATG